MFLKRTNGLKRQQEYMNRWDYKLITPGYIKEAADYQWKMYEGYRDDAKYLLETIDAGGTNKELKAKFDDARSRRDKYNQLLLDSYNKFSEIKDWRKFFTQVAPPKGCNEKNSTIPDTSGAIDWEGIQTPTPSPAPINSDLVS